jgi:hypothetical protein
MQGTKTHRDRKNGASREEWQARKAARNAERPPQVMGVRRSIEEYEIFQSLIYTPEGRDGLAHRGENEVMRKLEIGDHPNFVEIK